MKLPEPHSFASNRKCCETGGSPVAVFGGFSLIEMLITVALLIVISTMYFGFSSPTRQRSARKNCELNLQKIFLAQEIYARDNAGKFPAVSGARNSEEPLDLLVPRYTVERKIFICPGSKDSPIPPSESLRTDKISYAYYMGWHSGENVFALMSDAQVNTNSKSAGDEIFSATGNPPGNNHHQFGGNILFTDGHVMQSPSNLVSSITLTQGVVLLNPK
jgi:prepilin-type processing-associated H-X9-DG protein/prepilin-type N-terminal cleavage/methylation domain-containing protein